MSDDFYQRLDRKEAEVRIERIFKNRPENLHDYQGCANDPSMEQGKQPKGWDCHTCHDNGFVVCEGEVTPCPKCNPDSGAFGEDD